MSRKTMVRTITSSTIESVLVTIEGDKPNVTDNKPLVVSGTITEEKAIKEVKKVYGANAIMKKITSVDAVYEMTIEDFLKHAKKVEQPTAEQTAEGQQE